ncbi:drug/metabolite transporter (DMT)-like permease [Streptomyces sp. V4I23]|uniref:DMT family transporter n=1 Tax=Streptomyces sp. V4I23 TaxID=3042282 RepID=UPI0027832272|nr:EamA family transporter [Streptomyces sp. V4I23]MDQ1013291.1 drug/metabolite transporter (DMT)-like permease [Streptomyces sp. V4I23]
MPEGHSRSFAFTWAVFATLCIAWGSTWVAIRFGVTSMPPLWFAATRFIVAGLLLLLLARWLGGWQRIARSDLRPLTVMSAGAISVCFGLIFWGEQYVDSGTAGVMVQGFVPIGLFFFAATMTRELIGRTQWAFLGVGLCGVVLLLYGQSSSDWSMRKALAAVAIIVGTLVYDWAGVYGGDILSRYPAALMSAFENLVGGLILLPVSLVLEGDQIFRQPLPEETSVWLSWGYLVLVGSVLGFTAYTYLLRAWGPTRTSAYAFVTPVIALLLGATLADEHITWQHVMGTVLILGAVAGITRQRNRTPRDDQTTGPAPEALGTPQH